ncbi:flavin reductase family protein [Arthrobacter zhaoxinii]|uniref:flavin reductase family protein n=1 Tax=Arthrobacter zhaoxinii TaxID=2964616 RepID=UPI0021064E22|nr:flavin reductase family protein [Arthrobacter zhaoxinii]MCQ2001055.1 flavin reductase family protein [Arthrobacter zhaoxinii]
MTEPRVDSPTPARPPNRAKPTPNALRHALSGFATGITFVAAEVEGRTVGMLANSFTSVSLDPPLVSISFARTSTTWPSLQQADHWGISVLGQESRHLIPLLSRPAAQRFNDVEHEIGGNGSVLLPGAIASFVVARDTEIDAGDHILTLLHVLDTHRDPQQTPLVFYASTLHRLAA